MEDKLQEIKELIADQLNIAVDQVTENKEIVKDLGADSLDIVEMIMTLEEKYGVTVSNEETSTIKTVGDIAALINKN